MPNPTDLETDESQTDTDGQPGGDADGLLEGEAGGDSEADGSAPSGTGDAEGDEQGGAAAANDELLITLEGDEGAEAQPAEETAPAWVRDLRKANREKDRRIRDLERQVAAATPAPAAVVVGEEPTFEGCNFDADRYKTELLAWQKRSAEAERQRTEQQRTQEQQQAAWQKRIGDVDGATTSLRIVGADDAREAFESGLSPLQQAIVLNGPEDPKTSAMLRHAIGANPGVMKRLAAIQDPVRFAWHVAKLEDKMKTVPRKNAPAPDRRLSSGAVGTSAVDSAIEEARKRAEKSGDRTEVARLIRQRNARAA